MEFLADENVMPAHVSALRSGGHDVQRSDRLLEKGSSDTAVLALARREGVILVTYDMKDFSDETDHAGILLVSEDLEPRRLRDAVERIGRAYPSLDNVVEYPSDWA